MPAVQSRLVPGLEALPSLGNFALISSAWDSYYVRGIRRVWSCGMLKVLVLIIRVLNALDYLFVPRAILKLIFRHTLALLLLFGSSAVWKLFFGPMVRKCLEILLNTFVRTQKYVERQRQLLKAVKDADTFKAWKKTADALDKEKGLMKWKHNVHSDDYDYSRVGKNLLILRRLYDDRDIKGLIRFLRSHLVRNMLGINNRHLYMVLRAGTKSLIEDYIGEVIRALQLICVYPTSGGPTVRPETNHSITLAEKLAFFTETRHAYGRSALLLSGGGSLGLLHAGVVKCLHESLLLPRVLAGSSVGSILCGMLGTRTADEIDYMLSEEKDAFDLNFFDPDDSLFMGIRRFATTGYFLDGGYLMASIKRNIPPLTFQEAYDRTGRIINIVVSPSKRSGNSDRYRLLNYLTAPHVFITSAVIASCAIPGVYAPVELMAKDEDGHAVPYIEHDTVKWEDGSMQSDLPMHRLGELFNINNFIVSQVNPHILPFIHLLPEHMLSSSQILQGQDPSLMSLLVDPISKMILFLLMELRHLTLSGCEFGLLPFSGKVKHLLGQRWTGDITITPPPVPPQDYVMLLSNPTYEKLVDMTESSRKNCYKDIAAIQSSCAIEFTLDECIIRCKNAVRQKEERDRGRLAGIGHGGVGGKQVSSSNSSSGPWNAAATASAQAHVAAAGSGGLTLSVPSSGGGGMNRVQSFIAPDVDIHDLQQRQQAYSFQQQTYPQIHARAQQAQHTATPGSGAGRGALPEAPSFYFYNRSESLENMKRVSSLSNNSSSNSSGSDSNSSNSSYANIPRPVSPMGAAISGSATSASASTSSRPVYSKSGSSGTLNRYFQKRVGDGESPNTSKGNLSLSQECCAGGASGQGVPSTANDATDDDGNDVSALAGLWYTGDLELDGDDCDESMDGADWAGAEAEAGAARDTGTVPLEVSGDDVIFRPRSSSSQTGYLRTVAGSPEPAGPYLHPQPSLYPQLAHVLGGRVAQPPRFRETTPRVMTVTDLTKLVRED